MSAALLVMWLWLHGQAQTQINSGAFSGTDAIIWAAPTQECEDGMAITGGNGLIAECVDHKYRPVCAVPPADPVDVPAVQETDATDLCWAVPSEDNVQICGGTHVRWTCSDKSRVLLTSEDGTKHCIKFGVR